jgi:uncharacterized membrane protein
MKQSNAVPKQPAIILLAAGLFGFIASFVLTFDKIALIKDPNNTPACDLNPIISCLSAMNSPQAEIFGIPNSLFGIAAYAALITVSAFFLSGVKLPKRLWYLIVFVAVAGTLFMHYLLISSVFVLHVICPWCFGVWITTLPVLLAVCSAYHYSAGETQQNAIDRAVRSIASHAVAIGIVWLIGLIMLLLIAFWEYWSTLLPL